MILSENRIGGSSLLGGAVVGLAITAMLVVLGAALASSSSDLYLDTLLSESTAVAGWLVASLILGAFVGGRTAAVSAKAVRGADGALAGLLTWGVISLVLLALGGGWIAARPIARELLRPVVGDALWLVFVSQLTALVGATLGGALGARAEARRTDAARYDRDAIVSSPSTYERDFFGSSSLPTSHSGTP